MMPYYNTEEPSEQDVRDAKAAASALGITLLEYLVLKTLLNVESIKINTDT